VAKVVPCSDTVVKITGSPVSFENTNPRTVPVCAKEKAEKTVSDKQVRITLMKKWGEDSRLRRGEQVDFSTHKRQFPFSVKGEFLKSI